jgi:hypothetical protein
MADPEGRRDLLSYQPVTLAELQVAASETILALPYLLAVKFNYDVKQGGFAQLLYNLQSEFLSDIEEMLTVAGAPIAREYYLRVITACMEKKEEYFRFLASDYMEANAVKYALQLLSVEYFQREVDFIDEAASYLATGPRAEH